MSMTDGAGADVAIDITGSYVGLQTATQIIKEGQGKILAPSYYAQAESLDIGSYLLTKSPIIHATHSAYSRDYARDMTTGVWAASTGILPIGRLITHTFPFSQINEAFKALCSSPKGYVKGIVVIDETEQL